MNLGAPGPENIYRLVRWTHDSQVRPVSSSGFGYFALRSAKVGSFSMLIGCDLRNSSSALWMICAGSAMLMFVLSV